MDAYKIAQKQIMEDAPWLFLVNYKYIGAAKREQSLGNVASAVTASIKR